MANTIRIDATTGKKVLRVSTPPKKAVPKVDFQSGGTGADVFYQASGFGAMIENIGNLPKLYKDAAGYEVANILADIIQDSRDNYVPYQNGPLRDSAGSDEYVPAAENVLEMGCWYASPGGHIGLGSQTRQVGKKTAHLAAKEQGLHVEDPSLYAIVQHEDPSFKHPVLGPVATPQDKYLEKPFNKMIPNVMPRVTKAIEEAGGSWE
jgi:hypothetical protein